MSAGMAEVIAEHRAMMDQEDGYTYGCDCGWHYNFTYYTHAAHVAEELAKAGCGNVQSAKADAVREAAIDWAAYQSARMPRSDVLQVPVWLNQRAATMEASHGVD